MSSRMKKAVKWYQKATKQGDMFVQYMLGKCYPRHMDPLIVLSDTDIFHEKCKTAKSQYGDKCWNIKIIVSLYWIMVMIFQLFMSDHSVWK